MEEIAPRRGVLLPVVWTLLSGIVLLASLVAFVVGFSDSEGLAVTMAQAVSFPVGFATLGWLAALIVHFTARGTALRVAVPIVVALVGGSCAGASMLGFFVVLWPAL